MIALDLGPHIPSLELIVSFLFQVQYLQVCLITTVHVFSPWLVWSSSQWGSFCVHSTITLFGSTYALEGLQVCFFPLFLWGTTFENTGISPSWEPHLILVYYKSKLKFLIVSAGKMIRPLHPYDPCFLAQTISPFYSSSSFRFPFCFHSAGSGKI